MRSLRLLFVLLVLPLFALRASAQSQTGIWYFGFGAGIDFRNGAPTALTDGQVNTIEGCAAMADGQGNLSFYSDGVTVWNRLHQVMPNGTGLKGHYSSTQSCLIVPHPGNASLFFLFTTDEAGYIDTNEGVRYSVVNMCLNEGLGDVEEKNVFLFGNATEKLAAVRHRNGTDYWVVSSEYEGNRFMAYLVTEKGVSTTPVISAGGTPCYESSSTVPAIGNLKFSPDGRRLALASHGDYYAGFAELFDFDAATGKVSNPRKVLDNELRPYGVAFSPSGDRLYVSTSTGKLYQFDVTGPDARAIRSTATVLVDHDDEGFTMGLQLGPDSKIYASAPQLPHLSVIHHPERLGAASEYEYEGVSLADKYNTIGLPNFVASYFDPSPRIEATGPAVDTPVDFSLRNAGNAQRVRWRFGDGTPETDPSAPGQPARHTYPAPGAYLVRAVLESGAGLSDTVYKKIFIVRPVTRLLGPDTALCAGSTLTLDVSQAEGRGLWQDGSTGPVYQVTRSGLYWVEFCRSTGPVRDSVRVTFAEPPQVWLPADTLLCGDASWTADVSQPHSTYRWQDGSTAPAHRMDQAGVYWVEVTNACGTAKKSVRVRRHAPFSLALPADTTLPVGQTLDLNVYHPAIDTYAWDTGETGSSVAITGDGTYWVEAANPCQQARAVIRVTFYEDPANIFVPNVFTPNGDGINDVFETRGLYPGRWALVVHGRSGKQVYGSETYRNDWDGQLLAPGVYFYQLRNKKTGGTLKGWVHLLR